MVRFNRFVLGALLAPLFAVAGTRPSSADVTWTIPIPAATLPPLPPLPSVLPPPVVVLSADPPEYPRGLTYLDPLRYGKIFAAFAPAMGTLPAKVDLSADFPTPGDQGHQGSCVAWAVGYGLKSFQEHEERGWAYSKEHLMSPAFVFNALKKGKCGGGLYISDALDLVQAQGIAPLSLMPYSDKDCKKQPSSEAREVASAYRVQSSRRVESDLVEIKGHLAARVPVVVGMDVDRSFDRLKGATVYHGAKYPLDGGHAMVIVGYDDDKKAFKLFNSWGTNWADKGFGWVSYPALLAQAHELYVAKDFVDTPKPEPKPGPGPGPSPSPAPDPEPAPTPGGPRATLSAPSTMKNILVGDTYYFGLAVAGTVEGAKHRKVQLVVRFTHDGKPITSKDAQYADAHGRLAARTPEIGVTSGKWSLEKAPSIALPQSALRKSLGAPSGEKVAIEAYYDVYVDGFHIGRSPAATVTFRWG